MFYYYVVYVQIKKRCPNEMDVPGVLLEVG